jgi:hypothetical protein
VSIRRSEADTNLPLANVKAGTIAVKPSFSANVKQPPKPSMTGKSEHWRSDVRVQFADWYMPVGQGVVVQLSHAEEP